MKPREGTVILKSAAGRWQSHAWKLGLQGEARPPGQAPSLCKPHNDIEDILSFHQLKHFDFKES